MNLEFLRTAVEGYGGRLTVMTRASLVRAATTPWFRIDTPIGDTSVEVILAGNRCHVKAVGQIRTVADILGLLVAGERA